MAATQKSSRLNKFALATAVEVISPFDIDRAIPSGRPLQVPRLVSVPLAAAIHLPPLLALRVGLKARPSPCLVRSRQRLVTFPAAEENVPFALFRRRRQSGGLVAGLPASLFLMSRLISFVLA